MGTCALAAVCEERLLALLIIKLEPLTSVHTSRTAVLCREQWPGHRLACPVGLLGGRCDCRLSAGQDAVFSPIPHRRRVAALLKGGRRRDVHVVSHLLLTTCRSPPSLPHSLRPNECSRDRSVSLVEGRGRLSRMAARRGAGH